MSGVSKKLMGTTAAGGGFTAIEDVFSTYLYTGNDSTQTITNGIDLAGEGGLVWLKNRTTTGGNTVYDTERGASSGYISTNTTSAQSGSAASFAFNSDGFTAGSINNSSPYNYASWTFRKAPRFFDVVTYTGTGAARTVDHNLGTTVGSIIIKRTDTTSNWAVYHRGNTVAPETDFLSLNLTNATADDATYWNDTAPTDSVFTVGTNAAVNASGGTYVAYLYAHDPLGPSEDGSDGLIACGSFTPDGSSTATISLGWEPQWVLVKGINASKWKLVDTMRGWNNVGSSLTAESGQVLRPDSSLAEEGPGSGSAQVGRPLQTGFTWVGDPSVAHIYIAIRRGPMRVPESGTEVFDAQTLDVSGISNGDHVLTTGFPVDLNMRLLRSPSSWVARVLDRLRGGSELYTNLTNAEGTAPSYSNNSYSFDSNTGIINRSSDTNAYSNQLSYSWKRAPNFFDVVAYTGDGVSLREVSHNLKVSPELLIIKNRSITTDWWVDFYPDETQRLNLRLNLTNAASGPFTSLLPTPSTIVLGNTSLQNQSGNNYIAYLFSTLAGVSKVGSYTGNGTSQTIDCGFTTGARFILIKRTDSTGSWCVFDTARGIVAGNDPVLYLQATSAEVTSIDWIDPNNAGFEIVTSQANINAAGGNYIFYAIA